MHTEQRARFEAFAVLQGMHGILQGADENGFYKSNTVNFAHKVWLAAETPLLARIAELEGQLADKSKLSLPAEELKELIYSIHGSHHVGDAQHTKLDIINAQIDSLYSNREPFVVNAQAKYDELIYAVCRKFPNESRHETALRYIKSAESQAITAAGGRCE